MSDITIRTYEVTLTSPLLAGPLVVELIASSPKAAMARTRHYAFHDYKCADMLTADCVAVDITP